MEIFIYLTLLAGAISTWVYPTYFGDVKGDHKNGVPVHVYMADHLVWLAKQKEDRAEGIRLALVQ